MKIWIPCRLFISTALVTVFCASSPQAWAASAATATTLAITSGGNTVASGGSVTAGSEVTLTAGVSSGSAQLTTGQVNFCDASAAHCTDIHVLGTAQLTSAGKAVFRFRPGIGSHSYKAVFAGTPNGATAYAGSTSSTATLTVTGTFPTTTAIAASGSAGNYSLTATVTGTGSTVSPAGTVSFLDTSNGNFSLGTATLGAGTAGLSFLNAPNPVDGQAMHSFAVGDFNGDGILDLAVENLSFTTLTVLFGNGDGTFTPGASTPETGPIAAVGDFNGDGILDLVTVPLLGGQATVLLGDGTGNFTAKSNGSGDIPGVPSGFAVGDMNGDGILDLVAVSPDNLVPPAFFSGVTTLLGKGDGTFTAVYANSSHAQTGSYPGGIAVGDFNGDGILDLAVTDIRGGGVEVLLGDGHGNYAQSAYLSTGATATPFSVAAGDFNGDGFLDLAVANWGSNTVTILLGNGDGTFKATATSPQTGANPGGIAVGDFNGDGIPDLAVANSGSNTLTILLGNGDGTFTPTATSPQAGAQPGDSFVADFNGDGIPDLAVWNDGVYTVTVLLTQLTQTATATATGIAPLGTGTHQVEASYPGNSSFSASTSTTTSLIAQQGTPTVLVTPTPSSITTVQQLTVTIHVSGTTGNPTPTGSVMLTGGGYTSAATTLSGGIAQINVPAGALAIGADTLTASYTGDTNYVAATGAALPVTVTKATPAVAVTPSSSSITTLQPLTVTVAVTAASGSPAPTGSVTLTSGSYTSAATTLTSGSATISIPAGSLALGADTLTASYSGDANYIAAAATASVTVTNPTFTITGAAVSVTAGATTGNTSTITVTPAGGFTGSVVLTAAITSSPAGAVSPPTFSFGATSPVSITGTAGTATLTIATTAAQPPTCTSTQLMHRGVPWYAGGGAVLAGVLLFGIPARRRSWRTMLGMLVLLVALAGGVLACGGPKTTVCDNVILAGTTAGAYTVTITGTSGAITAAGPVALTVQ